MVNQGRQVCFDPPPSYGLGKRWPSSILRVRGLTTRCFCFWSGPGQCWLGWLGGPRADEARREPRLETSFEVSATPPPWTSRAASAQSGEHVTHPVGILKELLRAESSCRYIGARGNHYVFPISTKETEQVDAAASRWTYSDDAIDT